MRGIGPTENVLSLLRRTNGLAFRPIDCSLLYLLGGVYEVDVSSHNSIRVLLVVLVPLRTPPRVGGLQETAHTLEEKQIGQSLRYDPSVAPLLGGNGA